MPLASLLILAAFLWAGTATAQRAVSGKKKSIAGEGKPAKASVKVVSKQPGNGKKATEPVMLFKRTPCFGPCPHYEATIYADGRVSYIGYRYVRLTGSHELKMPVATVTTILADARRLRFATYNERYSQGSTDLPSTILSIRQPNGMLKTVQAEEGTPSELTALLTYISNEIEKISGGVSVSDR
ncbi:DUF6438 domain-containing protein [Hymenobacter elongatus]|uniref:DUF6438 domain-containing protein n=1 Tax=Hymenobacter elongatus TaxID=877208 RepID=A0A4Z0PL19_9BACT|nr:DUF6438 domain-containing protein [Hymenobacter elongatus]TGE15206.1 hypothetical protein E5J99_13445 [Hymenobacter elongatus]